MDVAAVNSSLALASIGTQILAACLLAAFLLRKRFSFAADIVRQAGSIGLYAGFAVALGAAFMNHFYNTWLGIPPCDLCWWGRIFLYPQIILFGMALWRDRYAATAIDASIALSVIGAGISLYHHLLQMFPSALPCPATGVSCAQRFLFEFGYVTYPMMALSLFAFLILTMLCVRLWRAR